MHRAEWWHEKSWQQNCSSNMASTWSRMIKWKILTTKLLFKHGMVFTWSSASSSWVLVWNLLKSFWNYHYSERSTFEVIIIKKELLNYRYKKSTFEISIIPHLPKRERPSVSEEWMKTSWRYLKCCSSSTHTSAYIIYLIVCNGINMIYNM